MSKEVMQQALDALLGYKPQSLTHAKEQEAVVTALRAAIAQPAQEPVYQYQLANGQWIDQAKESYDYNVKLGQAVVRVLYAAPVAQPVPCMGCNGNGEVGGLRSDGYDSEICPYCKGGGTEQITQPVQSAEIERLQGMVAAWKTEAEHQYGQLRLQINPSETDYPVFGALDAYACGKYAALREAIKQPVQPASDNAVTALIHELDETAERYTQNSNNPIDGLLSAASDALRELQTRLTIAQPAPVAQAESLSDVEITHDLADALTRVMSWIDNWSPSFTQDAEWAEDDKAARAVLKRSSKPPIGAQE